MALRAMITKLRRRRKSRSSSTEADHDSHHEEEVSLSNEMADLSLSDSMEVSESPTSTRPYSFGLLAEFEFDFKPTSTIQLWPGPPYPVQASFAPGVFDKARPSRPKSKHRSSKRKLSQENGQLTLRSKDNAAVKSGKEVARSQKTRRPLQYHGSPPRRDPPHHFLNLPGEIRNHVYRLLCVKGDPIIAQFRPIISPKVVKTSQGRIRHIGSTETTRRFPREPGLALVSRQVQREALSIFYSENKFVFRQSEDSKLKDLVMMRKDMMLNWSPKFGMTDCLTHVQVHFNARLLFGGKQTMNYTLHKLLDGDIRISNNAENTPYCSCFDKRVLQVMRATLTPARDLISQAADLVLMRLEQLQADSNLERNGSSFRTKGVKCEKCGEDQLSLLESGIE